MDLTPEVKQRRMKVEDLPAAAALEQAAGDGRWSAAQLAAELEKKIARYFVALSPDHKVVGYAGGWIIAPELQMANIVIHPEFRCQGIGRRLLETLITQAKKEGCDHGTLEVRRSNVHAQALYRAAGFQETSVRPRVYTQPDDDAVLMEKKW
jgi:[ribosomal protein S18]-alanine N-acetyltransferase